MPVTRALSAVLAVACAALLAPAPPPAFAEPSPAVLTWTVQPAGTGGPDGRRWIEHRLDPGQTVTEHLAVRNLSDTAAVFALKAADGYLTDKGRFNMLPSDQPSRDGGTWIAVQGTVTVAANETKVVPFTITVPRDAGPGDHPAGIAASIVSGTGTVQVESRVGFRVLLRAGGTLRPALSAERITVRYEPSWNPLRSGTVHVSYETANTGNVRVDARGRASVAGPFGTFARTRDDAGELLPGGRRAVDTRIGGVWALFRLRTTVTLTPSVLGDAGSPGATGTPVAVSVTTWALPWAQVVLAAAAAALVLALRHRHRRMRRLLADAREEGRRSAPVTGAGDSATSAGASVTGGG